jgi:tetrapyrrole methylase family protein/MazG family protein
MAKESFKKLYDIIKQLRSPNGCPWDIEQSPETLRGSLIEETYECVEAIDEGDSNHVKEELGDIFLLAVMISYIFEEGGQFSVKDVLDGISEKLVRRHPHVFGDVKVKDSDEVLKNWAEIKIKKEGRKAKDSVLDEVSRAMPPLDRAYKLQKKAAKAGFDWTEINDVFAKITEETEEVKSEISKSKEDKKELEGELGDLLFSVVNLCRFLKVETSVALQRTNVKFYERFRHVENCMKRDGIKMEQQNLSDMDRFWNEAKLL